MPNVMVIISEEAKAQLEQYLLYHEDAIDAEENDFGDLRKVFVDIFNREPVWRS